MEQRIPSRSAVPAAGNSDGKIVGLQTVPSGAKLAQRRLDDRQAHVRIVEKESVFGPPRKPLSKRRALSCYLIGRSGYSVSPSRSYGKAVTSTVEKSQPKWVISISKKRLA